MPPSPSLSLPEELLLLGLDPQRGNARVRMRYVEYGVAGAVLAELELGGHVTEERGRIQVINPLAPADPVAAQVLASLPAPGKGQRGKGERTKGWVRSAGRHVTELYLNRLVEQGALRRETRRFLGLFPYHRHPAGPEDVSAAVWQRLAASIHAGSPAGRDRALAALLSATDLANRYFPGFAARATRSTLRHLTREHWPTDAVHRAVKQDKAAANSGNSGGDGNGGGDGGGGGGGG
ncbi:GPP34 family phosphoprotein [Streptomyces sp. 21So2-11]|uniref:GOLPH3/VPS74 family protein n=1 Tax=Streptomyces sp. 21So2-11 TaxID=3144408 RepID=UPI003219AA9C